MQSIEEKRLARLDRVRKRREAQWADFEDRRAATKADIEAYAEGRYPITDRQRSFVRNFIQHWNAERAYEEAGYLGNPSRGVARLFRVPMVAAAIDHEVRLAAKKAGLTAEWVTKKAMELYPKLVGEEEVEIPVAFQGELIPARAKKFHASETKSLLEMLAKSTDFFEGGSSPDKMVNIAIDLSRLGVTPTFKEAIEHEDQ